jgi:hypothetical protein
MNIRTHLAMAAVVVVLAALGVLYFVLPVDTWTVDTWLCAVAVALALGAMVHLPYAPIASGKTQSGRLAIVGPMSATLLLTLLLAAAALSASVLRHTGLSWALLIACAAVFIVGTLLANVTGNVVDRIQATEQKDGRYTAWAASLVSVSHSMTDTSLKTHCTQMAEELRYAPSARASDAVVEASQVASALTILQQKASAGSNDEIASELNHLRRMIALHASALAALRSHA